MAPKPTPPDLPSDAPSFAKTPEQLERERADNDKEDTPDT